VVAGTATGEMAMKRWITNTSVVLFVMTFGACSDESNLLPTAEYLCNDGRECESGWTCRRVPGKEGKRCCNPHVDDEFGVDGGIGDGRVASNDHVGGKADDGGLAFNIGDGEVTESPVEERHITVDVKDRRFELVYKGPPHRDVAKAEPFMSVGVCIEAGSLVRAVCYSEDVSVLRERELLLDTKDPDVRNIPPTTFGHACSVSLSKDSRSDDLIHDRCSTPSEIRPHQFGMWYRRAVKVTYPVRVFENNNLVASATVVDWEWVRVLATGPTCPPPKPE